MGKKKAAEKARREALDGPVVAPKRKATGVPFNSQRGRLGALTAHANKTEAERTAHAQKMANARWATVRAERIAQGLPPKSVRRPLLNAEELEPWLALVDETFPLEVFPSLEARKRRAILLARRAQAEDELKYSSRDEVAGNDA